MKAGGGRGGECPGIAYSPEAADSSLIEAEVVREFMMHRPRGLCAESVGVIPESAHERVSVSRKMTMRSPKQVKRTPN